MGIDYSSQKNVTLETNTIVQKDIQRVEHATSNMKEKTSDDIVNVYDILNASDDGQFLLNFYKENQEFEISHRNLLCNTIINFILKQRKFSGPSLSSKECEVISKQIVNLFPNETSVIKDHLYPPVIYYKINFFLSVKDWYYSSIAGSTSKGRLYFKYRNMIRARKRLENSTEIEESAPKLKKKRTSDIKIKLLPIEHDAEDHIRALKHENLTDELFMHHWQMCVGERINFIKNSTVHDIIKKWPQYKQAHGFKLVSIVEIKYFKIS